MYKNIPKPNYNKASIIDSRFLQEPEGPPVLGLFGPPEIKEQVKEKDPFLENLENSPQNHEVLISSCNPVEKSSKPKNKDISKKTKKLENTDSPTYEREHLTSCFSEFINIKKGENDFFAVNNRIKTAEEVTVFGLGSFLRGFKKYADSISPTKNYGKSNKKQNSKFQKYSNNQELFQKIYDKPFRRFLSHDEKPFDESFLNELRKAIEIKENDGFKTSIKHFILVLEYMMKKNGEDFIFIKNSQLKDLFANLPSYFFQLGKEDHVNEYVEHQHQADDASEIIKVLDLLDWKSIFTADPNAKDSEKMKFILKTRTIPIWAGRYTMYTRTILIIRNLFIAYSTLINKVFCEGTIDLRENFPNRQKEAITFFDSIWPLFKTKKFGVLTIEDEDLPIEESKKIIFLNSFLCIHTERHFQIRINDINKNRNEALWKIIHLWLLHCRDDLHYRLFPRIQSPMESYDFKCFLHSFFLCIIKCYKQ
ncbi:expressed protein [Phakopsora pachyrhizi]|uniref:Expressed protein n=1 Tax=Phakopsora pachyrhizi TaxID=170000 RepID=A0AAV0BAX7_PHAPC|nr:expressed protein [Phakopsora pachyrhizi]